MKRTLLAKRYKKWKATPFVACDSVKIKSGKSEEYSYHLTKGKIYPIQFLPHFSGFNIKDDLGDICYCIFRNCAHLGLGDWQFLPKTGSI